jgi:hypothetical protein
MYADVLGLFGSASCFRKWLGGQFLTVLPRQLFVSLYSLFLWHHVVRICCQQDASGPCLGSDE